MVKPPKDADDIEAAMVLDGDVQQLLGAIVMAWAALDDPLLRLLARLSGAP